jgi:hypothetical protein
LLVDHAKVTVNSCGELLTMTDHHVGATPRGSAMKKVDEFRQLGSIKALRRFVNDHEPGTLQIERCVNQSLTLTTGQRPGGSRGEVLETVAAQYSRLRLVALLNRNFIGHRGRKKLQLGGREHQDRGSCCLKAPALRFSKSGHDFCERRFSAAVGAGDKNNLARVNLEVEVFEQGVSTTSN